MRTPIARTLRTVLVLTLAGGLAVTAATLARADTAAAAPKNLQILPKTMTKDQVKTIMKSVSKSLGVECDYCHDVPDMASDKNPKKNIARQMMRMTDEIDKKWLDGTNGPKSFVGCWTCHRGEAKPAKKAD